MAFIDKAEEFIDKAKVEQLTDKQLDSVAGGASTVYYSAPYCNDNGVMIVNTISINGGMTYDPTSKKISGSDGGYAQLSVRADQLDAFLTRKQNAGYSVVSVDIAGNLLK